MARVLLSLVVTALALPAKSFVGTGGTAPLVMAGVRLVVAGGTLIALPAKAAKNNKTPDKDRGENRGRKSYSPDFDRGEENRGFDDSRGRGSYEGTGNYGNTRGDDSVDGGFRSEALATAAAAGLIFLLDENDTEEKPGLIHILSYLVSTKKITKVEAHEILAELKKLSEQIEADPRSRIDGQPTLITSHEFEEALKKASSADEVVSLLGADIKKMYQLELSENAIRVLLVLLEINA